MARCEFSPGVAGSLTAIVEIFGVWYLFCGQIHSTELIRGDRISPAVSAALGTVGRSYGSVPDESTV